MPKSFDVYNVTKENSSPNQLENLSFEPLEENPSDEIESQAEDVVTFEDIHKWVDPNHRYERFIVWLWLIPVTMLMPCAYMNVMLIVYVPHYYCNLPQTTMNYSGEVMLPISTNSSCLLPDLLSVKDEISTQFHYSGHSDDTNSSLIDSLSIISKNDEDLTNHYQSLYMKEYIGWSKLGEEDQSVKQVNYKECMFGMSISDETITATTNEQQGWSNCPANHTQLDLIYSIYGIKTYILTTAQIGNLIGAIVFGILADKIGRIKVLILLSVILAVFGTANSFLTNKWIIISFRFIISLGLPAAYQVLLITGLEQVRGNKRAFVGMISSVSYSIGQTILGVYAWLFDWQTLSLVTSLPAIAVAFLTFWFVQESPSWYLSQGNQSAAATAVVNVAKYNDMKVTQDEVIKRLSQVSRSSKNTVKVPKSERVSCLSSVSNLLKYKNLTCRIIVIIINWMMNLQVYMGPMLRYATIAPNPLTGWALLSSVEIPACLLAYSLMTRVGRRMVHVTFMIICCVCLVVVSGLLYIDYEENDWYVYGFVIVAKLCVSITFLMIYIQSAELLPTTIRTTVIGAASLVSIGSAVITPYIMHSLSEPWISNAIMSVFSMIGILTAVLLPESMDKQLPHTLQEADQYSKLSDK